MYLQTALDVLLEVVKTKSRIRILVLACLWGAAASGFCKCAANIAGIASTRRVVECIRSGTGGTKQRLAMEWHVSGQHTLSRSLTYSVRRRLAQGFAVECEVLLESRACLWTFCASRVI